MTFPIEVVTGKPQPDNPVNYSPSVIDLFGVPLGSLQVVIGPQLTLQAETIDVNYTGARHYGSALIYAFAYQGHCYHLPAPVVLILPPNPPAAVGYGFTGGPFRMWSVDKLDRTLQLEPTADTFEEIILNRISGGMKQPMAYASRAQISHRGGKLSD